MDYDNDGESFKTVYIPLKPAEISSYFWIHWCLMLAIPPGSSLRRSNTASRACSRSSRESFSERPSVRIYMLVGVPNSGKSSIVIGETLDMLDEFEYCG